MPASPQARNYALFGEVVQTDYPFRTPLLPATGTSTLHLDVAAESEGEVATELQPVALPEAEGYAGAPALTFLRGPEYDVLRWEGLAEYRVGADRITLLPAGSEQNTQVEILFLGVVLSYWLERRGIPMLHASSVRQGEEAIAFLADSGAGKSTLAASFVAAGAELLTDDLLPLEKRANDVLARPGLPQLRLWPETAEHFLGASTGIPQVHPLTEKLQANLQVWAPARFATAAAPLRRVYLPQRRPLDFPDPAVTITPMTAREALVELIRNTFTPRLVVAAGLQPARLQFFTALAKQIPFARLSYPTGLHHLPRLRHAILDDLTAGG